jgi:MFS transporter, PAT family, beta-lactamase induction signal transducer AmpG
MRARPYHWFSLNAPFGATGGFVAVMLGFLGNRAGMSDATVAGLAALNLFPHAWKFFWAPIADVTLSRKKWYLLSNAVSCTALVAMAFIPFTKENLGVYQVLIVVNSLAITFLGMAVEGLLAHNTPEHERGRAAGWFQAGNLGGSGLGGGGALIVAENTSTTAAFLVLAGALASCSFTLFLIPDAPSEKLQVASKSFADWVRAMAASIKHVFKDLYKTLASRRGIIALVICFIPLCAGAAVNLFGAIAGRWQTSAETVAIVTGVLGGVVAAAGCLFGGWFSDQMSRRVAYVLSGVLLAGVALAMAFCPRNVYTYVGFTLAYQFVSGMCYGTFTAFVLEVIGLGAIATKYNALASLSNIPITYMTVILGGVSTDHGPRAMLLADAGSAMIGLGVLFVAILIVRPHLSKPAAVA